MAFSLERPPRGRQSFTKEIIIQLSNLSFENRKKKTRNVTKTKLLVSSKTGSKKVNNLSRRNRFLERGGSKDESGRGHMCPELFQSRNSN